MAIWSPSKSALNAVQRGAAQRMQLERAAFDEHWLKRLDAEAVQRRRTVEHDGVILDDNLERVPNRGNLFVNELLGGLDIVRITVVHELFHDERTEQLNRHLLRHTALIELQVRTDDDNASAGVVHALAEQVLAEAALLALEHIAERLERTGVRAGDGAAAAAVVDQGVNRLLQHALLVADDDIRRLELLQSLQTVVAVDDAAIEIVQIAGGKAAAVELNHRANLGRNDREHVNDHPLGTVAGLTEGLYDLKTLDELGLLLPARFGELGAKLLAELFTVDLTEQLLHGLGTHAGAEIIAVLLAQVAIFLLREDLALGQMRERHVAGIGDDIGSEVENLFQNARGQIQNQAHTGGDALEIPDMAHRGSQLNMTHALAANLRLGHLNAALVADFALIADLLILAAVQNRPSRSGFRVR